MTSQRDSQQGSGQRSAIGGEVKYGFPISQLDTVSREVQGNFTLVDGEGRIWTSAPDGKQAHDMLTRALGNVQPQGATT